MPLRHAAPWALDASLTPTAADKSAFEPASIKIERPTNDTYRVSLSAMGRMAILERTPQQTVLLVPNKKIAFVGNDGTEELLPLRSAGLSDRLVSTDSLLNLGVMVARQRDPALMGLMLMNAAQLQPTAGGKLVDCCSLVLTCEVIDLVPSSSVVCLGGRTIKSHVTEYQLSQAID